MKTLIVILLGCVLLSCTPSTVTPSLTSLESEMIGTWYEDQLVQFDSNGDTTSVSGPYCTGASLSFYEDESPLANHPRRLVDNRACMSIETGWSRDNSTELSLNGAEFTILTLTSSHLVLQPLSGGVTEHRHFSK